jgi:multidrug resistance efflux pump
MTPALASVGRVLMTLLFVAGAIVGLTMLWRHYEVDPWTRDGKLRADSVHVSADVSGLVTRILIHDNQFVRAGSVLFIVDKDRYAAQLEQADAAVERARATLNDAVREQRRYLALGDLVSQQERDQRNTAAEVDRSTLRQARADRHIAEINFQRSDVRARIDGIVTGLTMRPGDYVTSGSPKFALLDTHSYYVLGYFEETKLHRFELGDRAQVELLGDSRPIWGYVDSIAAGIADREDTGSEALLPNVTPTFSWIRLAQRIPVRIRIDRVPRGVRLVSGRTATVTILPMTRVAGAASSLVATVKAPIARAFWPSK